MDDRQSLSFDKLMKEQKKKKSILLTIVLVAAVLVFLLGLLFGIAISSNALAVPAGAEDLVREDPVLSPEDHVILRSASAPEYILTSGGLTTFSQWLISEEYTSSDALFIPSSVLYRYNLSDPSSSYSIYGVYFDLGSGFIRTVPSPGASSTRLNADTFAFDSPDLYRFFRYDVGLGYSDFVIAGFDQPIAVAEDTVVSIFTVGDKLLAFVTDNVLVLIPLILFLGVFAFGSIKKLITGV